DLRFEQLLGAGQPLHVVGVGVRGDDHFASGQVEVHLPDQLDDLLNGVLKADVDEEEFLATVDQVDVDSHAAPGLVVHFNDVRNEVLPLAHGQGSCEVSNRSLSS